MKKVTTCSCCILFILAFSTYGLAQDACTTIQDGTLLTSSGETIVLGFDQWGYNYQAHIFNGMYCDYHPLYRPGGANHDWCIENYGNAELVMKWNDAWLSNKDCNRDGLLDRHYGYGVYKGSGAWETNHTKGSYELNGKTCRWVDFVKIIAVPADATKELVDGIWIWYTASGTEIGPDIWGEFAIIEEIYNDPCAGFHGKLYASPDHPGLGNL